MSDLLERRETTFLVRINFMFLVKFLPDITLELEVVRMKGFCGWARRSWVFPRWIRRWWESGGSSLYWSKSPMMGVTRTKEGGKEVLHCFKKREMIVFVTIALSLVTSR